MKFSGLPMQRAAHYREQAAQLRELAAAALLAHHRNQLLSLAEQYESLAGSTEAAWS
jgi:hypothetical protein